MKRTKKWGLSTARLCEGTKCPKQSPSIKVAAIITLFAFLLTQCGIGIAAPYKAQNLREKQAVVDSRATGNANGLAKELAATGAAAGASTGVNEPNISRRDFLKVVGTAAATVAFGSLPKDPLKAQSMEGIGDEGNQAPEKESVSGKPIKLPPPSSELMKKFQEVARKIRQIPDNRVTAMFWDTANINPDKDFKELATFGFNEVIVDGYRFIQGDIDDAAMQEIIIAAHKAGIQHFKFIMGDPSWPYQGLDDAVEKTTKLAGKLKDIKHSLGRQGNTDAAKIIEGIAIDMEPHISPRWNFDLGPYCLLHTKLRDIARSHGLTYNRIEAFWYTQKKVETGQKLLNYTPPDKDESVYIMSYRNTGRETFSIAGSGNKHIGGFDLATFAPTGYKGKTNNLPDALLTYTDLSKGESVFIHSATISDLMAALKGWRETVTSPKTKEETDTQSAPSSAAIEVLSHSKADYKDATEFKLKITGLTDEQRKRARVIVTKKTDAYYVQPEVRTIYSIPPDGIVEVDVIERGRLGKITFYVVDEKEYEPREYFNSESQIKGVWVKERTDVQASLPSSEEARAFARFIGPDRYRHALVAKAVNAAPSPKVMLAGLGGGATGAAATRYSVKEAEAFVYNEINRLKLLDSLTIEFGPSVSSSLNISHIDKKLFGIINLGFKKMVALESRTSLRPGQEPQERRTGFKNTVRLVNEMIEKIAEKSQNNEVLLSETADYAGEKVIRVSASAAKEAVAAAAGLGVDEAVKEVNRLMSQGLSEVYFYYPMHSPLTWIKLSSEKLQAKKWIGDVAESNPNRQDNNKVYVYVDKGAIQVSYKPQDLAALLKQLELPPDRLKQVLENARNKKTLIIADSFDAASREVDAFMAFDINLKEENFTMVFTQEELNRVKGQEFDYIVNVSTPGRFNTDGLPAAKLLPITDTSDKGELLRQLVESL